MKFIDILGVKYSIEIISASELIRQLKETNSSYVEILEVIGQQGERFAGLCDSSECKIWINKDISNREKLEKIVVHEIVESIVAESLLDVNHEEVQAITNGLCISGILNISDLVESLLNEEVSKV